MDFKKSVYDEVQSKGKLCTRWDQRPVHTGPPQVGWQVG